jgi:hypothetical protein
MIIECPALDRAASCNQTGSVAVRNLSLPVRRGGARQFSLRQPLGEGECTLGERRRHMEEGQHGNLLVGHIGFDVSRHEEILNAARRQVNLYMRKRGFNGTSALMFVFQCVTE